jgi:ELWxxDGT repeat protein
MRPSLIAEALLSLALAAAVPIRAAEVPHLLADINTTPLPPGGISLPEPSGFLSLGGRMLFSTVGTGGGSDDEGVLWSTDGTASGTREISSICPYPCQGIAPLGTWRGLGLFRIARGSGVPEGEIWRTDGTTAGTFRLAGPIPNDPAGVQPIYPLGDRFFFFMTCGIPDFSYACVLFRSDGTRAGTAPFAAAGSTSPFTEPHSFAVWRDRLVFIAFSDDDSLGLWSTDGTPEGTVRLADVQESEDAPAPVVPTSSHLFFGSGETGEDLWMTDGAPGDARRLADFDPVQCFPPPGSYCNTPDVNSLTAIGDEVLFLTFRTGHGEEIWRSDGTESGTRPVLELAPPQIWGIPERLPGNRWLFAASASRTDSQRLWTADDDFTHAGPLSGCDGGACPSFEGFLTPALPQLFVGRDDVHGAEVWITDGTGAGTHLLADVCPGPCSGFRARYGLGPIFGSSAGKTWFPAFPRPGDENSTDYDLWVTDGTPGGTHRAGGNVTSGLGFLGDLAFFGLDDPDREDSELWATDATPAGTREVTVLQRLAPSSFPAFLPLATGALLQVYDGTQYAFWRSDGTPGGAAPLVTLPGGRQFMGTGFTQVGGLQFFTVDAGDRVELWRTDGTAPGTLSVARLPRGTGVSLSTAWRGRLLFQIAGKTCAFWTSDGTPGGTYKILSQPPGQRCPTAVQAAGDRFLFVARIQKEGGFVPQIFLSDGTVAGTRQISQIRHSRPAFEAFEGSSSVTAGGITFFKIFHPGGDDTEIWRTDGTGAGTYLAFNSFQAADLVGFRGSLYFTGSLVDDFYTRVLYRVPASGGEPIPLAEISTSNTFAPAQFTPAGDRLFFAASDGESIDLWVTDGTPAGTRRATTPGSLSIDPNASPVAAGNRVFFSADDGEHGHELWESDGTPGGTRMVWDLNPGGFSSNPANLTVSGNYLFFGADDGETGAEPWVLRLEP